MGGQHEDPDRGSAHQFSKPVRKKPPKSTAFSSGVWGFLIKKKLNWRGCSSVEKAPCSSQDKSHHPTALPLTRARCAGRNPAAAALPGSGSWEMPASPLPKGAARGTSSRDGQGGRCRLRLKRSLRPGKPRGLPRERQLQEPAPPARRPRGQPSSSRPRHPRDGSSRPRHPGQLLPSRPHGAARVTGRAQVNLFIRCTPWKAPSSSYLLFLKKISVYQQRCGEKPVLGLSA